MITPARILNRYRSVEPYLPSVRDRVRETLLRLCDRRGFAHASRIKTLESLSEKIETGRFRSWADLDDLVAFTVVVPTLADEPDAVTFLQEAFQLITLKARGSSLKSPDVFRFDSTRFIGKIEAPEDASGEIHKVAFEVQVKSAFEHAWSVATHSLAYKSPDVSWSRLRLTAQLKAAVEQLDTLILAFETTAGMIEPSVWPEVKSKKDLKTFLASLVSKGQLPIELTPKDWNRYIDNCYRLLQCCGMKHPDKITGAIQRSLATEINAVGVGNIPMSISLWQFTFASLVKTGVVTNSLADFWPIITPELEELYPDVRSIDRRFDYS